LSELVQFRSEKAELLSDGALFDAKAVRSRFALFRTELFFQETAVAIAVQQFINILYQVHFIQQRSLQFTDSHIVPASRPHFKRLGCAPEGKVVLQHA
jgi:hypothetical protein